MGVLVNSKEANSYAREYKLYMPDKKLSQKKLRQWLEESGTAVSE